MKNKVSLPLSVRISEILTRLNNGEVLFLNDLIEEFKVSKRTIQRDIHDKLGFLPYEQEGQKIWIDPLHLGQLNMNHIQQIMEKTGLNKVLPKWNKTLVNDVINSDDFLFIHPEIEKVTDFMQNNMVVLKKAIKDKLIISFRYKDKDYPKIQPYQLSLFKGMWYLVSFDVTADKIKTFKLISIKLLSVSPQSFEHDDVVSQKIKNADSVWIGSHKMEVKIRVDAACSFQFKNRNILPRQIIEEETESGELLLKCEIYHHREILPVIQYWLPYLTILSPESLKEDLILTLNKSLKMHETDQ